MADPIPQIGTVVINCTDPEKLSAFWMELLAVGIARQFPGFIWLEPQGDAGIGLAFQQVDEPTPGRNRLHLDSAVPDVEAAQGRVEDLGGSFLEDHEIMGFRWKVMADPEDNEFCIAKA